ncbi:MAG TPA: dTDP-4-amino-4,6-dideoxygalactose transaminase [Aggregatilineaceae bacterium]|nr:dTDP-4-amino-4,6-dideoxygalactose transaminase [Aggregatilineaceae bacterium]
MGARVKHAGVREIPFTRPQFGPDERQAVLDALETGAIGGNGAIGAALERDLEQRLQVRRALMTTSCTHALEMAAMASGWGPGDEVILPSFGFVTAATAIVRQGARPVFAEIDLATWNLDPVDTAARITPRTRAILPVHYAGQGCNMAVLETLARRFSLTIVEDAAQAFGAKWDGRWLGTFGDIGCFSLHATKNVVCGEGGIFVTNTPKIADRAEIIREKGTNRHQFLRGEVDKYSWVEVGSSYVLSDLLAALARVQIARCEDMQRQRSQVWWAYQQGLADLAGAGAIILPYVDMLAEPNWHIYAFRVAEESRRDSLLAYLKSQGIQATFHFVPLHSSPYGREKLGYAPEDLPITELVSRTLVRLPIYPDLSADDQAYVLEAVHNYFMNTRRLRYCSSARWGAKGRDGRWVVVPARR